MRRHWTVVVNRAAGRTPVSITRVIEALASWGVSHELAVPEGPDETRETVREALGRGIENVAVVGGDGTVSLVADEMIVLGADATLGVLPSGTGCDLLRTFALPQDLLAAAKHLTTDDTYMIDAVVVEAGWGTRHFLNVAQAGVGAAAAETAPRISRRLGPVRYPLAFAARLPRFPKARVKVTTDRRTYEAEALAVIVANAQFFAGGWNVAPRATLMDGVVDVQVISAKKREAPALVPKVIKGTHLVEPTVRRFTAAEFTIETEPEWPFEADGDFLGNTPIKGRVVPAAIRLKI
jgi:diacylglycerol kinase (ATP)